MDLSINIGGMAGQGIDTIGDLLTKVFVKTGFYIFTVKDFESRIRGGYNFTQIRVADNPVHCSVDDIDLIVALSKDAISAKRDQLVEGGIIIFDDRFDFDALEECHYPAPLSKKAREVGGSTRMTNAAALGALLSVIRFPFSLAEQVLTEIFGKKGEKIVEANVRVARSLYDLTEETFSGSCRHNLSMIDSIPSENRLIINGNQAIAYGAMAANVKWVSSYPMSPSTSAFIEIVSHANDLKIGTLQTEDELASLAMAIGASYGGVRSMVTTSGGGFSLMVEALGLAGMTETPVVIYNAQRPGPSTGLPTRTEQSDLLFTIFASQGEFPRIVLAPRDPLDAFDVVTRSFNLAERFQVPVIILGDQYLADSVMNVPRIDVTNVEIDRGKLAADRLDDPYMRYRLTDDGISPRAFPGDRGRFIVSSGNSHLEDGHITEDPAIRNAMVQKFLRKITAIKDALKPPDLYGAKTTKTVVVTWGSPWGAVREAIEHLEHEGVSIGHLHFTDIYPLRTKLLKDVFTSAERVISIEHNATSQFAKLVTMETGLKFDGYITKFDGRPMTPRWVILQLKEVGI
ncbi:MAG: 2-oxoacid:acceptor oxidoreductase subunit alpha [Candidatus Thorarchaeota archaeon]|nr:2-oxoacid:acceptor oxidoreductase subunit alpha [Candidatus Thorarchaeota archaeon]